MTRLVGRERVTIVPIDRSATVYDPDTDEPYARLGRSASFVISAQVNEIQRNRRFSSQDGSRLPVRIEVAFRRVDVTAASWSPADGDVITQVAERDGTSPKAVRWRITGPRRSGKLQRERRALVVVDCIEETPARGRQEGL